MAKTIEMSFDWLTHVGPRNHYEMVSRSSESFATAWSWKMAMQPFVVILWPVV